MPFINILSRMYIKPASHENKYGKFGNRFYSQTVQPERKFECYMPTIFERFDDFFLERNTLQANKYMLYMAYAKSFTYAR